MSVRALNVSLYLAHCRLMNYSALKIFRYNGVWRVSKISIFKEIRGTVRWHRCRAVICQQTKASCAVAGAPE